MADGTDLERTLEAGIIALLTVVIQIRDGKKGEPEGTHILEAKQLLNKATGAIG